MFLNIVLAVISIAMVLYHMVSTQRFLVSLDLHQNVHLAFALVIVFLAQLKKSGSVLRFAIPVLILLSLAGTGYIFFLQDELINRLGVPTTADVITGIVLITVVLVATHSSFGIIFPVIALGFVAYAMLGHLVVGQLAAIQFDAGKVIAKLTMLQGMYGAVLDMSANQIFLFIFFGALLQVTGATSFFMNFGKLFGRWLRGGPAITSVASSALVGMVTGSVTVNALITGPLTIPLMKKVGYKPAQAAAIESSADVGSQIMPPVLGATAFVMAAMTGIPYVTIVLATVIPAILYFFCVGVYAQLKAVRMNVTKVEETLNYKEMLMSAPIFFVPLISLSILLLKGYSPTFSIFWSTILVILLGFIWKKNRPSIKAWLEAFKGGALAGSQIGVICAGVGLVVTTSTMTGLAIKIPMAFQAVWGNNLTLALTLSALMTLILGCGMPTTAAYILAAMVSARSIINMGVDVLPAHLFIFFFATVSMITPPVGVGALVTAKIAGAGYFETGWEAVKSSCSAFILPYLFIWMPALLLQPQPVTVVVFTFLISIIILVTATAALCGQYLLALNAFQRLIIGGVTFSLLAYVISGQVIYLLGGLLVLAALTAWQIRKRGRSRVPITRTE